MVLDFRGEQPETSEDGESGVVVLVRSLDRISGWVARLQPSPPHSKHYTVRDYLEPDAVDSTPPSSSTRGYVLSDGVYEASTMRLNSDGPNASPRRYFFEVRGGKLRTLFPSLMVAHLRLVELAMASCTEQAQSQ